MHHSRLSRRIISAGLLIVCSIGFTGCGSEPEYKGPKRYAISGKVTFDGEPVNGGTITITPEDGKSNPSGGVIENGEFQVPEAKGGNPGKYRVLIHWHKPTGEKKPDPDTGESVDQTKQVIPAYFNDATELTLDVTEDPEKNVFNFDLKTK